MSKNWTVPVERMNQKKVYELSNPPPNWDKIDPYSDLEDVGSDHHINVDKNVKMPENATLSVEHGVKTLLNKYHLRERKSVTDFSLLRKSKHDTPAVTYMEDDSHSSDSDFSLQTKRQKNQNMGLHEPSRTRLRAQAIINATNLSKNSNSEKSFPVRAKDKPCPYCDEMFYYLNGVQTHITHTHADIISIKGIANPGVMGENEPPMIGKNEHLTDSVMGTNGD